MHKKLAAMLMGAIMAAMPLAGSALADYTLADFPAPFVIGGTPNFLIVIGSGGTAAGIANDLAGLINVAARLGGETVTTSGGSSTISVSGESVGMASGTSQIYLQDAINEQRSTITKDNLATILADGTFVADDGTTYDYEQSIIVDDAATFQFSTSGNDIDDPDIILQIGDTISTTTYFYRWKIDFATAVDFNDADSEGEGITLGGKDWTVGSSTDADTLQLLGGSDEIFLDTEDATSATVTIAGTEYTIYLKGITSDPNAVITVETGGTTDTDTISSGATKKVNGLDVYVKTANYYGLESKLGDATLVLGADEIYLEDDTEVMVGASKTAIEGTLVDWTTDCDNMTTLSIYISAADDDLDHLEAGDKFEDPVFETLEVLFAGIQNGPTFASPSDTNTARHKVDFQRADDTAVQVEFTDSSGNTKAIEFVDAGAMEDSDDNPIHLVEGVNMSEDEYFILNSGDYQHYMQLTKVSCDDDSTADDDVWMKDVFTGTVYKMDDKDLGASGDTQTITIKGQTYTIYCQGTACADGVRIYSSDFDADSDGTLVEDTDDITVYPYIGLVSGMNHKLAFTDDVYVFGTNGVAAGWNVTSANDNLVLNLPTGDVSITVTENTTDTGTDCDISLAVGTTTYDGTDADDTDAGGSIDAAAYEVSVGEMDYIIGLLDTLDNDCYLQIYVQVDRDPATSSPGEANGATLVAAIGAIDGSTDNMDEEHDPAVLFVEEEDNADGDAYNAIFIPTEYNTYQDVEYGNLTFTSDYTYEDVNFDDTDYQGNMDSYGALVIVDTSDTYQNFVTLTFPEDQMYGEFFFGETGITASGGSSSADREGVIKSNVAVVDTDVTSTQKSNYHLILGGGPAVNKMTAEALGLTYPTYGADSGIPEDGYMIELVPDAFVEGNYVLVIAGWEAEQTQDACSKVQANMASVSGNVYYYPAAPATEE